MVHLVECQNWIPAADLRFQGLVQTARWYSLMAPPAVVGVWRRRPADGTQPDPVSQPEQFALDACVAPPWILGGHPIDQLRDLGTDRRAAVTAG